MKKSRDIDLIVVHCTATHAGCDVRTADIDRYHRSLGWKCIGYHYVVLLDGTVDKGRDEAVPGAHCRGHNARSIGVAYVGGIDDRGLPVDSRTDAQRKSLLELLRDLRLRYPSAVIRGHRDLARKACPCFDATAEYSGI